MMLEKVVASTELQKNLTLSDCCTWLWQNSLVCWWWTLNGANTEAETNDWRITVPQILSYDCWTNQPLKIFFTERCHCLCVQLCQQNKYDIRSKKMVCSPVSLAAQLCHWPAVPLESAPCQPTAHSLISTLYICDQCWLSKAKNIPHWWDLEICGCPMPILFCLCLSRRIVWLQWQLHCLPYFQHLVTRRCCVWSIISCHTIIIRPSFDHHTIIIWS